MVRAISSPIRPAAQRSAISGCAGSDVAADSHNARYLIDEMWRGTNYVLESSPALGSQAHWLPELSLTLSNSFNYLPPPPMTNRSLFLRIKA